MWLLCECVCACVSLCYLNETSTCIAGIYLSRAQLRWKSFTLVTLAGQRVLFLPPKLWDGVQHRWCMYFCYMFESYDTMYDQFFLFVNECALSLSNSDSADKVVLQTGKYEELIVCSHEIAASTAQLVAASKVTLLYRNVIYKYIGQRIKRNQKKIYAALTV